MNAPTGMKSPDDLMEDIKRHTVAHYEPDGQNGFKCKECGAQIQQTTCFVSVHNNQFGNMCAGSGKVKQLPLPYCPSCEGVPTRTSTCVHI